MCFSLSRDANIIYNRKLKKKRERRKSTASSVQPSSAPTSGVALTKKVRSEQRSLLNAEYDTFRASQSDINRYVVARIYAVSLFLITLHQVTARAFGSITERKLVRNGK